jgi:hypothetical protein
MVVSPLGRIAAANQVRTTSSAVVKDLLLKITTGICSASMMLVQAISYLSLIVDDDNAQWHPGGD